MDTPATFTGFSREAMSFFAQLKRNNERAWFDRHREQYVRQVLDPARAFVVAMGPALNRICPGLVADPAPGGSIFRIHRDTRFSADKTPYKTHLGIYFWQSGGRKMDRPGFYFELDESGIGLYAGWYIFSREVLKAYRKAVADEERGSALAGIVRRLRKTGLAVGGQSYKRVPRGFDVDEERGELLRHGGIYTEQPCGKIKEIQSAGLVGYCVRQWKRVLPLQAWLKGVISLFIIVIFGL